MDWWTFYTRSTEREEAIMDITGIGAIGSAVESIVNHFFPDKTEQDKQKAALEMAAIMNEHNLVQGQLDTNKAEASSASMFVAGWRPFVGWVCGSGFAVQFVVGPLGSWAAGLFGHPLSFPNLDLGTMMPLLLGMLGLGGMRSFEKVNGVNSGH